MKLQLHLTFLFILFIGHLKAQQRSDFAVELAAFDQSVPLSYFKGVSNVYETFDVNQIYRYHIAAASKTEADEILQKVKQAGFPNARVIDFNYLKTVCEAQCGYVPPKPTGVGMSNKTAPNNNQNVAKKSVSINASDLLGKNALVVPETSNSEDEDWLNFLDRNKDLGLTETELADVYKKHGNIRIDHADWFIFKKKNKDLGATEAELMGLYIKHGNIQISQADWFIFKKATPPANTVADKDAEWLDFKTKNQELGATDAELKALFAKHGNIKISQAIWFDFKENAGKQPAVVASPDNSKNSKPAQPEKVVQTIGFVMFEFGGTQLGDDSKKELDKVASALVKNKNLSVQLIGHADAVGTDETNQAISMRRAENVNQYLTIKGVPVGQVKAIAKGESDPIAINNHNDGSDSPEGRKYNRRVDLLVLDPDGNPVNIVSSIQVPAHLKKQ